jgi:hypothetical protein
MHIPPGFWDVKFVAIGFDFDKTKLTPAAECLPLAIQKYGFVYGFMIDYPHDKGAFRVGPE